MGEPQETWVSSTDVTFSDEDGSSSGPTTVRAADSPASGSAASTSTGAVKERTSATISRPNARASKTAALSAINASRSTSEKPTKRGDREGSSSTSSPAPAFAPHVEASAAPHRNPARYYAAVPKAPRLEFETLRTYSPRYPNPPPRPAGMPNRLFGLEHAPVYHPTIEEFAQPMQYIEKVSREAQAAGICKIVPPEGWRPPFALNTETFRFKTRLQQLNSMEASARASLNFLEQLHIFHRQHGSSGISVPTVAGKPLDLWKLKREVGALGGYSKVTSERKWSAVGRSMGYSVQISSAVCTQIKTSYLKIIVPFEDFVNRVKLNGGTPPPDPTILNNDVVPISEALANKIDPPTPILTNGAESLATPSSEIEGPARKNRVGEAAHEKVRTASDKLNEALGHDRNGPDHVTKLASLIPSRDHRAPLGANPGEVCEICTMDHEPNKIVLCDGCDRGYHLACLSPPLPKVPTSQFYCEACLLNEGAEYGFEEGPEHSLHSFRRRADAFKRRWLADHPVPERKGKERAVNGMAVYEDAMTEQTALEDHIEREFWRLVESPHESVEVEYGADLNHSKEGGGFPNLELHAGDPYSRDGWNLNNLPILAGSLLRYIKSDISGMTLPWMYSGMVFSTFAWHKEDHYTYSINYHHWGDTKTWYGIPGTDDVKLEAAMKRAAPELFEQQPDLMFQLVTLMSPGRLQKQGVRVVACDQRPNEFVITFPRAYHTGFNHGFNFNEAVNFALPDWLPMGLDCVERYRTIRKNPVFSHDELLLTISQHEKSPRASRWLYPNIRQMVQRELALREAFRRRYPGVEEIILDSDVEEEEYQCDDCRALAYLAHVVSSAQVDGQTTSCLEHVAHLAEGPDLLRLRYSDDDLRAILLRVKSRSDKAGRVPELHLGQETTDANRTTGRKRKPSVAAIEAAEDEESHPAQRVKADVVEAKPPSPTKLDRDVSESEGEQNSAHAVQRSRKLYAPASAPLRHVGHFQIATDRPSSSADYHPMNGKSIDQSLSTPGFGVPPPSPSSPRFSEPSFASHQNL